MAARPRLLFLAQCLPYPPHSGVASRTFNILRQLQVEYDIDLVAFSHINHHPDRAGRDAACRALGGPAVVVAEPTPIPSQHSTLRKIWDHLRSVISGRAYTYYQYDSRAFGARLRGVLRTRMPDLVHVDSLDLHRWLPELPQVPIACTHHDIESDLLRRRARSLPQAALRHYMLLQADRVERLERELCPRLTLNVMMSGVDARKLQALAPGVATVVVPNGTDTDYFRPNGSDSVAGRVAFVGPTYSYPNRDAVEFLLQEIWPKVRGADDSTTLRLIGRCAPADRARYDAEPGVTTLGYLPDVRPPLLQARCCVVPIRIGGGTRIKILDAWAMGKAVVSTSIGCEGLDAVDGENILIRDTPDAMAGALLQVLRDARLRSHLERNARRTATETYSWDVVGRLIRSAYDQLLSRSFALHQPIPTLPPRTE
jgi:glycosyltransferase involved in cell wall biosynthesis